MQPNSTYKPFFSGIGIISVAAAILLFALNSNPQYEQYAGVAWASFIFFLILTIVSFVVNVSALESTVPSRFILVFITTTTFKLLLSLIFIIVYMLAFTPVTNTFIIPFFLFFAAFKVVEVYYLVVLGKR
ncbi:MAG TPA: hypothetical protein VEA37_13730, partial [Flavobacterium sp.]|nr:hypothetical protein [Flavobacterium sp.]